MNTRKAALSSYLKYCGLSLILALAIFLPWLDNYFVSDDWPAILRNMRLVWKDVPGWFTGLRAGWYRPLHDLFVALCWQLFALHPPGYRLVSILLYALVSANVGTLAHLITGDGRIGALSTISFAAFATHAEPVLWFAATNELLAGLFASNSAISFVLFRRAGSGLWLVAAGLNCLLAFASKETALFLPLTLLAYDLLFYQSTNARSTSLPTFPSTRDKTLNWRFFLPSLAIVLLGVAFLSFRVSLGGGYAAAAKVTLPRLAMNLAYYVLIGILAIPNNYAFRAALPSWKTLNALPIVTLVSSVAIIITIGWIWFRERIWLTKHKKSLLFALVWAVGALAPVIFIVSERAVFMSSVGIALAFAILFIGAWDIAQRRGKGLKRAVAIAIVLYIGLNASVLRYRGAWWAKSAETSEAVLTQLDSQIKNQPHGTQILLVGLPDYVAYTFTFRNTFPAAARVLQYDSDVKAVLDTELTELSPQQQRDYIHQLAQETNAVVFWYRDGELVPEEN